MKGYDGWGNKLPTLNYSLMQNLVTWAGQDQALMDTVFKGWGNWLQSSWAKRIRNGSCQSAFCIAGQAVAQSGYLMIYTDLDADYDGTVCSYADNCAPAIPDGTDERGRPKFTFDEDAVEPIEVVGQRVLGLTSDEAGDLFGGDNSYQDVVRIANECAEARGLPPFKPVESALYDYEDAL